MNPLNAFRMATVVSALTLTLAGFGGPAASACRIPRPDPAFSMEVLVDGRPLQEYASGGTAYIEALKGREYEIRLTNKTGERVAVALAVDGLNSIDAAHTSARDARKWILAPWESITLSGWQTGSGTARRFVFTSEAKSYGAWLGRTSDLGVISAAFFREVRRPDPIAAAPAPMLDAPAESGMAKKERVERDSNRGDRDQKAQAGAVADELAATGIGREIEHRVVRVEFDQEDTPASTISLRYEYRDALVRLGVIPKNDDALARREHARGFADTGFAPDPFRRR